MFWYHFVLGINPSWMDGLNCSSSPPMTLAVILFGEGGLCLSEMEATGLRWSNSSWSGQVQASPLSRQYHNNIACEVNSSGYKNNGQQNEKPWSSEKGFTDNLGGRADLDRSDLPLPWRVDNFALIKVCWPHSH